MAGTQENLLFLGLVVRFRQHAPLAQSAEQLTLNQWVPGSSPGGRTKSQFLLTRAGIFYFARLSNFLETEAVVFVNLDTGDVYLLHVAT